MSDDEVMRFEITDQDLANEFNYELKRPRISKNRATYGIWAANSDDDEDGGDARPSFSVGGSRSRGGGKPNYAAPVGFVSAGVQQSGKKLEPNYGEGEGEEEKEKSDDDESLATSAVGGRRRKTKTKPRFAADQGEIAGLRTAYRQPAVSLGKGFGDWEKYTRGIGAKLLLKMGYESGKGLGKDLQGRSTIVEAHLRKGRGAIGAYGREKGAKQEAVVDSEEEEEKDFREKLHQWKKGKSSATQKVKYVYKSADQVLEEGQWRKDLNASASGGGSSSRVKVIDMTKKESRVLSGYHAISAQQMPDDDEVEKPMIESAAFDLPELRHNVDLILDKCEEDIISADRKLKHNRNRVEVLREEEERLSRLVDKEKGTISTLENVLECVEKLEHLHQLGNLDLGQAKEMFSTMMIRFPDEYVRYELPYIAVTVVTPLIRKEISRTWRPLENGVELHKEEFEDWERLLSLQKKSKVDDDDMDPFDRLLWETWMPNVRAAIAAWNPRSVQKLTSFLTVWRQLLPSWMWTNVLDQQLLPKLQNEVELWNPLTDSVPLHSWLHPWLPFLADKLEIVYPTIRNKLASALTSWHPSDRSAKLILMPWKDVFPKGSLQAFVLKNIYPKLEQTMESLVVNPHQQKLDQWNWVVVEWQELLPVQAMINLLDKRFFPKWLQVLAAWLNHNPNYDEVTKWYKGWKSLLPSTLLSSQQIRHKLNQGLEMMTRVVTAGSGHPMSMQPGAPEAIIYLSSVEKLPSSGTNQSAATMPVPSMATIARTASQMADGGGGGGYKDLVARRCEEMGILFAPVVPPRYREGKPIYQCGDKKVYLDRSAIVVQSGENRWIPTSLNALLDTAA